MREPTFWEKIKYPFTEKWNHIEYYFAKRWLDRMFGKQEYWGDYLQEKLHQEPLI